MPFFLMSASSQNGISDTSSSLLYVFGYLLMFCGILALAYLSTRFLGSAYDKSRSGTSIHVVDRRMLSQDKSIVVVKIADVHYVLYTDRNHTTLLDKRSDYPHIEQTKNDMHSFTALLKNKIQNRTKNDSNT